MRLLRATPARAPARERPRRRTRSLALATMLLMAGVAAAPESLPPPERRGPLSLEEAIRARRSVREFAPAALSPRELSQLLWAAQGVTGTGGLRAAPSAGALYPLQVYVVLPSGCFHYDPARHRLVRHATGDLRSTLQSAALGQRPVTDAPAVFVIAAEEARTRRKYGPRAERCVAMEAGHAAQNLLLQAVALGLAGLPIGAFDDDRVARALILPAGERPLYLIPVGHPR